jgi:hypothetical protein
MWAYLIAGALFLIGVVGAAVGGGIFTIVLIPIAILIAVAALLFSMWGRAAQGAGGAGTHESHTADRPLPTSHQRPSGRAPSSPEGLADARRAQQ